jgi:outer membrane protein assembly factor BamE (lipoprotein component of BamABCDE complex)
MAVTLVKRNTLSGLTKKQVLDLLGQPDNDYQDKSSVFSNISYRVKDEWTLTIYFKNDQFEEAGLRLPMMMTIHRPLRMIHTV